MPLGQYSPSDFSRKQLDEGNLTGATPRMPQSVRNQGGFQPGRLPPGPDPFTAPAQQFPDMMQLFRQQQGAEPPTGNELMDAIQGIVGGATQGAGQGGRRAINPAVPVEPNPGLNNPRSANRMVDTMNTPGPQPRGDRVATPLEMQSIMLNTPMRRPPANFQGPPNPNRRMLPPIDVMHGISGPFGPGGAFAPENLAGGGYR